MAYAVGVFFANPFAISSIIALLLFYVLLAAKVFAFVEALRFRGQAYPAAGKQTKQLWLILTGLSLAFHFLSGPTGLLSVAGDVASLVFLVDVRPALRQVSGRGGGSQQNMGPYGPW